MRPIYLQPSICLLVTSIIALCACERETYTSWNCKNAVTEKIPMVLNKAQMQFQGNQLHFCGSLGEKSYFDSNCPAAIEKAKITFIPSTGVLLDQGRELYCEALWAQRLMPSKPSNPIHPKKLLLTKWTAVQPINKQKHFLVSKVILPEPPNEKIEFIELEAVFSKKTQIIPWRDLVNPAVWIQGWQ